MKIREEEWVEVGIRTLPERVRSIFGKGSVCSRLDEAQMCWEGIVTSKALASL